MKNASVSRTIVRGLAVLLLAAALLPAAGCGKKGPLYLPQAASATSAQPAVAPASDTSVERASR